MPRRDDRVAGLDEHGRKRAGLKILLRAQQRKIEPSRLDPRYRIPGCSSAISVSIGKGVAQMSLAGIGMALDDSHTHGRTGTTASGALNLKSLCHASGHNQVCVSESLAAIEHRRRAANGAWHEFLSLIQRNGLQWHSPTPEGWNNRVRLPRH